MLKIGQKLKIRRFLASVAPNEVEKFARMKSDWWDQSGQNAALHSVSIFLVSQFCTENSRFSFFSRTFLDNFDLSSVNFKKE